MTRVCMALAAAVAMCATVASAQAPPPVGNYGGGAVPAPPKSPYGAGALTISLRATPDGKLQIRAGLGARCETVTLVKRTTLAPDGTFAVSGTTNRKLSGGRRLQSKYTFQGSITGANATGTASVRNRVRTRGGSRTCKSGTVAWGAARALGDIGTPGAAVPGAHLYGNTSQQSGSGKSAIVLRISPDGKLLTRALYDVRLRCGRRVFTSIVDTPRRNLTIGVDGRVKDVERFTQRVDADTRVKSVGRFTATIGSAGASGTFSILDRFVNRRTGRSEGSCRTGTVKWAAAL